MDTQKVPSHNASIVKWLATVGSFIVAMTDFALLFTLGAMYVHLLDKYGSSRATTALVQSLFMGIGTSCGTGVSFMFVSSSVIVGKLFKGNSREIALAFQTFCTGVGMVGYPFVLDSLDSFYGVNGAFLLISGFLTNNFVIAFLFHLAENSQPIGTRTDEHSNKKADRPSKILNDIAEDQHLDNGVSKGHVKAKINVILKTIREQFAHLLSFRYIIVVAASGIVASSINGILVVLMDLLSWKGLSPESSLICFIAVNLGQNLVIVLHIVLLKLKPDINPAIFLVINSLLGVIGQLLILCISDKKVIILGSVLTGWTVGGVISGSTVAVAALVNVDHFGVAFGLLLTVLGILSMVSGPLYGYIRDSVQSYELVLLLTASLNGFGAVLYAAAACRWRFVKTTNIVLEKPKDIS